MTEMVEVASARPRARVIPRWMRRVAVLVVVMLAAAGVQFVAAPTAQAATCGTNGNYHDGFVHQPTNPQWNEGVSANITSNGGYVVCTTDTNPGSNFTTAWTMAANGTGSGWAQSGPIYRYGSGSCVKIWAQQSQSGFLNNDWYDYYLPGCVADGTTAQWWQQMVGSPCPYVLSNWGANTIRSSGGGGVGGTWSPHCGGGGKPAWQFPLQLSMMGETTYPQSDIPGTVSAKTIFAGILVQPYLNPNSWLGNCPAGQNAFFAANTPTGSTRYKNQAINCNDVRVWTQ